LVHRDVKPANVLVSGDGDAEHAYLTDFGLTKHVSSSSGVTHTGQWVGTLDYVAPEQISGGPLDARVDVYSLGCVLFQALSGRVPYPRDADVAKMYAHLNEPPERISELVPGLPQAFDGVVHRALAMRPDDRYPSSGDLGRAALAAVAGDASAVPERSVAGGAAAPVPRPESAANTRPESPGPPLPERPEPTRRLPSPTGSRPRWPIFVICATALVIAGIAAFLIAAGIAQKARDKVPAAVATPTTPTLGKKWPLHLSTGWPAGVRAYTVLLASVRTRSAAETEADRARAAGLRNIGVLYSSNYNGVRPGYWVVFDGVGSDAGASGEQALARRAGFPGANVRYISPR
jgi:serine/threonine protein kinase